MNACIDRDLCRGRTAYAAFRRYDYGDGISTRRFNQQISRFVFNLGKDTTGRRPFVGVLLTDGRSVQRNFTGTAQFTDGGCEGNVDIFNDEDVLRHGAAVVAVVGSRPSVGQYVTAFCRGFRTFSSYFCFFVTIIGSI